MYSTNVRWIYSRGSEVHHYNETGGIDYVEFETRLNVP